MKLSTIIACAAVVTAFGIATSATAEAKTHIGFSFGGVSAPRVYERVYVPAYYCEPVYVLPRPVYRERHVVPGYRERVCVQPRIGFSIGFWR